MKNVKIIYQSEWGKEFHFTFDAEKRKGTGLDKILNSVASLSEDHSKYMKHIIKSEKANILGQSKKHSEHWKQVQIFSKKASEKTKKTKLEIEKARKHLDENPEITKDLEDEIKKNVDKTIEQVKESELPKELTLEEIDMINTEFTHNKKLLETEGIKGILKHMDTTADDLEQALTDPKKALEKHSPVFCATCMAIFFCALIIAFCAKVIYDVVIYYI